MQIQRHLIHVWITISLHLSRLILSRTVQRCLLYSVIVVLIAFGLYLLGISDLSRLGISALHLLNSDALNKKLGAATGRIETLFELGTTPVIPSLATDKADEGWLNVNADTAAAAVAGALEADKAIFLTDTPGVLRDRSDPRSLLPKLSEQECRALIASGVIDGGMVPKVEACFEALAAGAHSALILDGRVPYSLLDVFLTDTFTGTEITR